MAQPVERLAFKGIPRRESEVANTEVLMSEIPFTRDSAGLWLFYELGGAGVYMGARITRRQSTDSAALFEVLTDSVQAKKDFKSIYQRPTMHALIEATREDPDMDLVQEQLSRTTGEWAEDTRREVEALGWHRRAMEYQRRLQRTESEVLQVSLYKVQYGAERNAARLLADPEGNRRLSLPDSERIGLLVLRDVERARGFVPISVIDGEAASVEPVSFYGANKNFSGLRQT